MQRESLYIRMQRHRVCLILCLLFTLGSSLTTHHLVEAAVSKGTSKRLQAGEANEGGPGASSATSGRRQQISIGVPIEGVQLTGTRFRVQPGFLPAATAPITVVPPQGELDITILTAKTQALGTDILAGTWQADRDPIFLWERPSQGLDIAGYSFAVDALPDDVVETTGTSWDVAGDPQRFLADGKHNFSVKAIGTSGTSGQPKSFEIWIDTTPPTIHTHTPNPGTLWNTLTPGLSATVSDMGSGINPSAAVFSINGVNATTRFDVATGALTVDGTSGVTEGSNLAKLTVADHVGNTTAPLVWSFTVDITPPTGTLLINGGAAMVTSVYVSLHLTASDALSGIAAMRLSNDPVIGYVEEPFIPVRQQWKLNTVNGLQTVYARFVDKAGNSSAPVSDQIELMLLAPDTLIVSGPAGAVPDQAAEFRFECPEGACVFSYAFDDHEWSDWAAITEVSASGLAYGNHYFRVKAARDVNGTPGIQIEEEDPSPAERTWIVGVEPSPLLMPQGPPVKVWRLE